MSFLKKATKFTNPGMAYDAYKRNFGSNGAPPPESGEGTAADQEARANRGVFTVNRLRELSQNPSWNNGHTDWANVTSLYNQLKEYYQREPTQQEINQYAGIWASDPGTGAALLAQDYNSPDKVAARQKAQYEDKAPQFYGAIDSQFQSTLGRSATDAEKKHFGSLLASGQVDDYTLGQFLTALPEAVKKQDAEFRSGLSADLQKQDQQYYNEQVLPTIQDTFANQGRDIRSSGFANSLALAAQQQNRQRESFLSNLSAQQYGGSQGLAQDAYRQAYGNYQGLQDYTRQRAAQMQDATLGRTSDLSNFNLQQQAYDDYLRRYGKRSNGIGALVGGLVGAGAGAYFGGPQGASAGYGVGSGLGGAAQTAYQGY